MKTNELIFLMLSLATGILLGLFFFWGLWFTVRKMLASRVPALLALFSFIVRSVAVLAGFYLMAGNDIKRLLACAAGFFVARLALKRKLADHPLAKVSHEVKP